MNNILIGLILMSAFYGCTASQNVAENEARSKKALEQIKEKEKEDNLSSSEKKVDYDLIMKIRDYEKQLNLGKTQADTSAQKELTDNNEKLSLIVHIKPNRDSTTTAVKIFIEEVGGVVHKIGSWYGRNMCIYCDIPIGSVRKIAEIEDIEKIRSGDTLSPPLRPGE
jgi:hypothetical protein